MNRRIWTGVLAGVLAAAVLLTVGIGAYRAGQDDEIVTRVVPSGEPGGGTEVVRVVGDHDHFGPGPFFFLFPLLIILLVVFVARRSWGHGRWGHGWAPGGPVGPGWHRPYGPGFDPGHRYGWLDEWHRQAHEEEGGRAPAGSATSTGSSAAPEGSPSDESPEPPAGSA
jgi:hypothetical protein